MELDSRLTATLFTPSSFFTLFSTCALHAAQVMPFTSNVILPFPLCYFSFLMRSTTSSTLSRRPAWMSSTMQVCMCS